eukprot:scaffold34808_cov38-Phaeocystis_antarctica.AAC.1
MVRGSVRQRPLHSILSDLRGAHQGMAAESHGGPPARHELACSATPDRSNTGGEDRNADDDALLRCTF